MNRPVYTVPRDPGPDMVCPNPKCRSFANAQGPAFRHGRYESRGGPVGLFSRRYKCNGGHSFKVTWSELIEETAKEA